MRQRLRIFVCKEEEVVLGVQVTGENQTNPHRNSQLEVLGPAIPQYICTCNIHVVAGNNSTFLCITVWYSLAQIYCMFSIHSMPAG